MLKINVSDSNQLIVFLQQFGPGDRESGLRTSRSLLVLSVPFYRQDARGIGHADGLDWAPNSVGAR